MKILFLLNIISVTALNICKMVEEKKVKGYLISQNFNM